MRAAAERISIRVDQKEAISIIAALQKGIDKDKQFQFSEDGATMMLELLIGSFQSGIAGVHWPKKEVRK